MNAKFRLNSYGAPYYMYLNTKFIVENVIAGNSTEIGGELETATMIISLL